MTEIISFWGGISSIVALLATVMTLLHRAAKSRMNNLDEQRLHLQKEIKEILGLAESATTQGKRVDLYIYKESILADARFSYSISEMQVLAMHALSFFVISCILFGDFSTSSYLDTIPWKPATIDESVKETIKAYDIIFWYHTITILALILANITSRREQKKIYEKINLISHIFIYEYEGKIFKSLNSDMSTKEKYLGL